MANKIWLNVPGDGSFECRNASGALFDPTTVTMWIKPPNSSEVAVSLTNESVGRYSFSYTPTEPGAHTCRIEGLSAGTVVLRGKGAFMVSPEVF